MLLPTKYENLENNIIVLGYDILKIAKRKSSINIEELFQIIRDKKSINLERYYNTLSFLWIADMIELDKSNISVKKKNYVLK